MSQIQLAPYINFQGRAREAMEFYHEVLGGTLELATLTARGLPQPAGPGDRIHHARLEADGAILLASDGHPDYPARAGDHLAIALRGTDGARLARIFDELARGGRLQMPLTAQPGGTIGWLEDRFGNHWTVQIDEA